MSAAERKPLAGALLAEFLGTAGLLCAVIGSGIMAQKLSGGNDGVALIANTLATVFALFVLIEVFGPVSGAHFNPAVTLALAFKGLFRPPERAAIPLYIAAQLAGAAMGAWAAHAMFGLPILQLSSKARAGWGQLIGEFIATAGLMLVILRAPAGKGSALVACYIGAATGSPRARRSRTRPRWPGVCSPTHSPASRRLARQVLSWPNSLGPRAAWSSRVSWSARPAEVAGRAHISQRCRQAAAG